MSLHVTSADEQDRSRVKQLAKDVQEATGDLVRLAFVDQGYTGEQPEKDAAKKGIELSVVKLPQAKRGFVLLPRRWVVERSFGWMSRFRRLARDYEWLASTLAGFHFIAFACVMLRRLTLIGTARRSQHALDPTARKVNRILDAYTREADTVVPCFHE